jgi:chromosome partitioning protein
MSNRAQVIAITSLKGGSGKTSLTSLLARYYAETKGKQVLVVDFDSGAGMTALLVDKYVNDEADTIVEVLQDVKHYVDPRETFSRAVIYTGLEKSKGWEKNNGSIILIPSKPTLGNLINDTNRNLLDAAISLLHLSDDYIVLIDSGPDLMNALLAIGCADVVFIPTRIRLQYVQPSIDTLRAIRYFQKKNNSPSFGGWIYIQRTETQWEKEYLEKFTILFETFLQKSNMMCTDEDLIIQMIPSRFIQRGNHLTWSIRDDIFDPIRQMAEKIHQFQITDYQES